MGARLISESIRFLGQLHELDLGSDKLKAFVVGSVARDIRRYRSIALECEHGLIENAEALGRALYEGMLSIRYVLDMTIPAEEHSSGLQKRLGELPPAPDDVDLREFRLRLYVAKSSETLIRLANDVGESESEIVRPFKDLRASLPSGWRDAQRNRGYSGLSFARLAEYCGMLDMHQRFYYLQCHVTHANDALGFVGETEEGYASAKLSTDFGQAGKVLSLAAGIMFYEISTIEVAFGCDSDMDGLLEEFRAANGESG